MGTARPPDRRSGLRGERGVGLMEVIVATVIAVIAVLALAYTFGMGRGLIGRFETARVAFAAAQRRMETLSALPLTAPELRIPVPPSHTYGPDPVQVDGRTVAFESWTVEAWDDPGDGTHTGAELDLKRVTVRVSWGARGPNETVTLTRLFPAP